MSKRECVRVEHECVYGVIAETAQEISVTDLCNLRSTPCYMKKGRKVIGLISDYLDRRRNLATHYVYCPYCGKKLDRNFIKEYAYGVEESLYGILFEEGEDNE